MKELWYGCPNCYLAFYRESEYRHHFELNHSDRKYRLAGKIASAGE